MKNGRCRMHGGKSTGPRTPEGRERSRRANWKHGRYIRTNTEPIRTKLKELHRVSGVCAVFLKEVDAMLVHRTRAILSNRNLLRDGQYQSLLSAVDSEEISTMYEHWLRLDPNGAIVALKLEWLQSFSEPLGMKRVSPERALERWLDLVKSVRQETKLLLDAFERFEGADESNWLSIARSMGW